MEKRIRVKLKNPNPLFKQWLKEWIEEAEKKKKKSSKTYQRALDSLEKYPLTLYSGHDCSILEGFGAKICDMLEKKLQEYLLQCSDLDQNICFKDKVIELKNRDYDEMMDLISNLEAANFVDNSVLDENASKENLSMIVEEDDIEMKEISSDSDDDNYRENVKPTNEDLNGNESEDSLDFLIKKYQPEDAKKSRVKSQLKKNNTDPLRSPLAKNPLKKFKSFNANVAGPSYSSSPKIVAGKSPKRGFSNDDELNAIINKYRTEDCLSPIVPEKRRKLDNDKIILTPVKYVQPETENKEEDERKYISVDDINTSDYEVILVIDIGEAKSKTNCEVQTKIAKHDIRSVVKKLHIGDFVWVASHKTDTLKKYVLPYIIERKRLDDLAKSIKDDRFHEQKFRLKQCGVENIIYLVENLKTTNYGLPFETLTQAIANTLIQNKFQIKVTDDSDHTVLYLALMTNFIKGIFYNKKPIQFRLFEFEVFNQAAVKQRKFTARETFIKQLMVLKGLSVDVALEIVKYFPTPSHLYEKYSSLSKSEGENLLTKIKIGEIQRKIPSNVSKVIYNFYTQSAIND